MSKTDSLRGPPSTALRYDGPIQVANKKDFTETFTFTNVFSGTATAASNALAFNPVYTSTLVTSSAQWTSVAGLYQEVRCLAVDVQFVPSFQNFGYYSTNGGSSPINSEPDLHIMAPYHADGTAFSNRVTALYHSGRNVASINQPNRATVRMSASDEAIFYSVSGATFNSMGVKVWFAATTNGGTDQLNWGSYIVNHTMQFRSRTDGSTQLKSYPSLLPIRQCVQETNSSDTKSKDRKDSKVDDTKSAFSLLSKGGKEPVFVEPYDGDDIQPPTAWVQVKPKPAVLSSSTPYKKG